MGKERQEVREEKKAPARCHTQSWPDPGVDFFYFDLFLLYSMLIPYLILKSTLIFQILTYWRGTALSFLGFNVYGPIGFHSVNSSICALQPKTPVSTELILSR